MSTQAVSDMGLEGMPPSYRHNHGAEERVAHERIVARRGASLVHVEICPGRAAHAHARWICVVTDDRPGLLSLLTAGISAHSLDIQSARIYCRVRSGRPDEAIDLFAVRDTKGSGPGLIPEKIGGIRRTIEALLRGDVSVSSVECQAAPTARPGAAGAVSVRFEGSTDLLVVEARDRPGLLLSISLAIFREGLTIVRSHVSTLSEHARDEFEIAHTDGRRLSPRMRDVIADKVRAALEDPRARESESFASAR